MRFKPCLTFGEGRLSTQGDTPEGAPPPSGWAPASPPASMMLTHSKADSLVVGRRAPPLPALPREEVRNRTGEAAQGHGRHESLALGCLYFADHR